MVLCLPFLVELEFGNVGFQGEAGCKESQFYSLPFGQAVASMYI